MEFNPYRDWLGLSILEREPDDYELLGLAPYESDADRIRSAIDQRTNRVRQCRPGPNLETWQNLLDHLAEVRRRLTDPERKARYDNELREWQKNGGKGTPPGAPSLLKPAAAPSGGPAGAPGAGTPAASTSTPAAPHVGMPQGPPQTAPANPAGPAAWSASPASPGQPPAGYPSPSTPAATWAAAPTAGTTAPAIPLAIPMANRPGTPPAAGFAPSAPYPGAAPTPGYPAAGATPHYPSAAPAGNYPAAAAPPAYPGAGPAPNYPGAGPAPNYPGAGPAPNYPGAGPAPNYPGAAPTYAAPNWQQYGAPAPPQPPPVAPSPFAAPPPGYGPQYGNYPHPSDGMGTSGYPGAGMAGAGGYAQGYAPASSPALPMGSVVPAGSVKVVSPNAGTSSQTQVAPNPAQGLTSSASGFAAAAAQTLHAGPMSSAEPSAESPGPISEPSPAMSQRANANSRTIATAAGALIGCLLLGVAVWVIAKQMGLFGYGTPTLADQSGASSQTTGDGGSPADASGTGSTGGRTPNGQNASTSSGASSSPKNTQSADDRPQPMPQTPNDPEAPEPMTDDPSPAPMVDSPEPDSDAGKPEMKPQDNPPPEPDTGDTQPKPETDVAPEPEPEPAPDPMPEAPKGPTREAMIEMVRAMDHARKALGDRRLSEAKLQLEIASKIAVAPEHKAMIGRLELLRHYVDQFWDAVREGMKGLNGVSELQIRSTIVSVVDASEEEITIRASGRNMSFERLELPSGLARTIAERWLDANSSTSKVILGAFLAVDPTDPEANLEEARRLWKEAELAGAELHDLAMVLDDRYDLSNPPKPRAAAKQGPLPEARAQAEAVKLVKERFAAELRSARTPEDRQRLVRTLVDEANAPLSDEAERYALLLEAREAAVAGKLVELALEVVDQTLKWFEIDELVEKHDVLAKSSIRAAPAVSREIAVAALQLVERAIDGDQFEVGTQLARVAGGAARTARDQALQKRATDKIQEIADLARSR